MLMQPEQTVFSARRSCCAVCMRPQSACICQWVTPVAHQVEILILQHPLEVANAKGSARLLHLSLPGSRMVTGEVFDLEALLQKPKTNVLLYPAPPPDLSPVASPPNVLPAHAQGKPADLRLIVIDATWRKSRKILYRNAALQQLPRLSLNGVPESRYRIRKAHKPGQLSTLEASCLALAQLEGDAERYAQLLRAFDGFVAQQLACKAA